MIRVSGIAVLLSALGLLSMPTYASVSSEQSIRVLSAWTRPTPPGISMAVGYLTIENHRQQPVTLSSVSSPWAHHVDVHESRMEAGMVHMGAMQLQIGAGESVHLRPGGLHLMLMDLTQPLRLGQAVPVRLSFSDGQTISATLVVRADADRP
jgi:hypothetical protein